MSIFKRKQSAPGESAAATDSTHGVSRDYHDQKTEERILAIGQELLSDARSGDAPSASWSDKLMNWAMKDEEFKVQLFRFIDTFPTLKTPDQVHAHLVDYLNQPNVTLPPGMGMGLKAGGLLKKTLSKTMGLSDRIYGHPLHRRHGCGVCPAPDQILMGPGHGFLGGSPR